MEFSEYSWQAAILSHLVDVAGRSFDTRVHRGKISAECNANAKQYDRESHISSHLQSFCIRCSSFCQSTVGSSRYQTSQEPLEQRIYDEDNEWCQEQCTRDVDLRIFYFAAHTNTCFKSGITPPDPCQDLDPCLESRECCQCFRQII